MKKIQDRAIWAVAAVALVVLASGAVMGRRAWAAYQLGLLKADGRVQRVSQANTDFGLRMLNRLAKDNPKQNVFFSPLSVSQALSMTMNGAGGATRSAMAGALGLNGVAIADVNAANGRLLPSLENADPQVDLQVANALWVKNGVTLTDAFQNQCRDSYGAQSTSLDLQSPAGADTINHWVSKRTNGKIDKIVLASDLRRSEAVLTNAVYFHGKWASAFGADRTLPGSFQWMHGRTKTVSMMSQKAEFDYGQGDDYQAVRIPYGSGRMSLYVVLPKSTEGVDALLKSMDAPKWRRIVSQTRPTTVELFLPRFRASYGADFRPALTALGMGPAFADNADLTPMGLRDAHIARVMHKAILEVDENGSVAAAATAVENSKSISIRVIRYPVMRIDHPFFCAVRDDATGTLLFAGVIRDPEKL